MNQSPAKGTKGLHQLYIWSQYFNLLAVMKQSHEVVTECLLVSLKFPLHNWFTKQRHAPLTGSLPPAGLFASYAAWWTSFFVGAAGVAQNWNRVPVIFFINAAWRSGDLVE